MDTVELIKENINEARFELSGTMADVTPTMCNWAPPGKAHSIGALYAHIIQGEDMIISGMLQGKAPLWQRDGWDKKLNIPNNSHQQEQWRTMKIDLATIKPYAEAVTKATEAYLASLKPADLERKIPVGPPMGDQTVAAILQVFFAGNVRAHTGEISALKGVQGFKGYPF